jgi:MFS family permease
MGMGEAVGIIFANPTVLLLMVSFLGANFVATIFLTWTPTFLVEKFHFQLAAAGLSGAAFIHLASAFGSPTGGVLADRLSRRIAGGRIWVQAAGLCAGAVFLPIVGLTAHVWVLLAAMVGLGFSKGLYDSNIFASVYDAVPVRARSTVAGLMNTVGWGGGALGPLVVGVVTKYGKYGSKVANMSHAIAWTCAVYLGAAGILITAAAIAGRLERR